MACYFARVQQNCRTINTKTYPYRSGTGTGQVVISDSGRNLQQQWVEWHGADVCDSALYVSVSSLGGQYGIVIHPGREDESKLYGVAPGKRFRTSQYSHANKRNRRNSRNSSGLTWPHLFRGRDRTGRKS